MNVYVDDHIAAMAKELLDEFGLDLQTAVEEIELEAEYEEYFSGANLEHLKHSIAQAETGKIMVHDLLEA